MKQRKRRAPRCLVRGQCLNAPGAWDRVGAWPPRALSLPRIWIFEAEQRGETGYLPRELLLGAHDGANVAISCGMASRLFVAYWMAHSMA